MPLRTAEHLLAVTPDRAGDRHGAILTRSGQPHHKHAPNDRLIANAITEICFISINFVFVKYNRPLLIRIEWRYNSEKVTETTEMNTDQRRQLANLLKNRRQKLGLSANETARRAGINQGNYWRIEAGQVAKPNAEKLRAIGHTLGISASELFATTGWMPPAELPALRPYLRTRYHLPPAALAKLEASVKAIATQYGISIDRGPAHGEDEHPHPQ